MSDSTSKGTLAGLETKTWLYIAVAVAAAMLIAVVVGLFQARANGTAVRVLGVTVPGSAKWFASADDRTVGAGGKTPTVAGSSTATKTAAGSKSGAAPGSSETSAAGGGSSATTTKTAGNKPAVKPKTYTVRVIYWNDTVSKPRSDLVLGVGKSPLWKPGSVKKTSKAFGPMPFGGGIMYVYPSGPSGPKYSVELLFANTMMPDSEQDAVHVQVRDGSFRVLGNPVLNFERQFSLSD